MLLEHGARLVALANDGVRTRVPVRSRGLERGQTGIEQPIERASKSIEGRGEGFCRRMEGEEGGVGGVGEGGEAGGEVVGLGLERAGLGEEVVEGEGGQVGEVGLLRGRKGLL